MQRWVESRVRALLVYGAAGDGPVDARASADLKVAGGRAGFREGKDGAGKIVFVRMVGGGAQGGRSFQRGR